MMRKLTVGIASIAAAFGIASASAQTCPPQAAQTIQTQQETIASLQAQVQRSQEQWGQLTNHIYTCVARSAAGYGSAAGTNIPTTINQALIGCAQQTQRAGRTDQCYVYSCQ